jgi:hypothetical protein
MSHRPATARLAAIATLGLVVVACSAQGGAGASAEPSASIRPAPSTASRPTVPPSGVPVTGEVPDAVMTAVLADLSARTGTDASSATVTTGEAVEWNDGSLGCPEIGVMYIQQITPGYHVVLSLDGKEYDYRVAGEGKTIRLCEGLKPAGSG